MINIKNDKDALIELFILIMIRINKKGLFTNYKSLANKIIYDEK